MTESLFLDLGSLIQVREYDRGKTASAAPRWLLPGWAAADQTRDYPSRVRELCLTSLLGSVLARSFRSSSAQTLTAGRTTGGAASVQATCQKCSLHVKPGSVPYWRDPLSLTSSRPYIWVESRSSFCSQLPAYTPRASSCSKLVAATGGVKVPDLKVHRCSRMCGLQCSSEGSAHAIR